MLKTLTKWFIVADITVFVLTILLGLATRGSNDFSGLIVIYPLIAVMFLTVSILVLLFLRAVKDVGEGGVPNDIFTLVILVAVLLGIPWIGYRYAISGQNRESLIIITKVAFIVGSIASLILIVRFIRRAANKR